MKKPSSSPDGRRRWGHRFRRSTAAITENNSIPDVDDRDFAYSPLNRYIYEIRVLKLAKDCNPASLQQPLRLTITTIRPRDSRDDKLDRLVNRLKPYYAISYTWGEDPQPTKIVLNGQEATVPSSAVEALRGVFGAMHAAGLKKTEYVWIDAICIDQNNQAEKSQQVVMMRKVYSQAKGVLVWWGTDQEQKAKASFRSVRILMEDYWIKTNGGRGVAAHQRISLEKRQDVPYSADSMPADFISEDLFHLLDRRWFSRLWVVQEVILAKVVFCFYGDQYLPWIMFSVALRWAFHRDIYSIYDIPQSTTMAIVMVSKICQGSFDNTSICELLSLNLSFQTSNRHDRIYAVSGLFPLEDNRHEWLSFDPGYERSVAAVYAEATYVAMADGGFLHILLLATDTPYHLRDPSEDEDWPSWVPDYHALACERSRKLMRNMRFFQRNASNGVPLQYIRFDQKSNLLSVKGVIAYTVYSHHKLSSELHGEAARTLTDSLEPGWKKIRTTATLSCAIGLMNYLSTIRPRHQWTKAMLRRVAAAWGRLTLPNDNEGRDNALNDFATLLLEAMKASGQRDLPLIQLLEECSGNDGQADRFAFWFWSNIDYCSLITLTDGRLGLCTDGGEKGDSICILHGSKLPVVLRRDGEFWRFRGLADVAGIMVGEYIQRLQDEATLEAETQIFNIK